MKLFNNMSLTSIRLFALTLVSTLWGGIAFAEGTLPGDTAADTEKGGSTKLVNPLKDIDSLQDLLLQVLDGVIIPIGFIFLTIMVVYVGFLFVMAQGKDEKLQSARSALVWTVIGGLILLGAKAIALFIQATGAALAT